VKLHQPDWRESSHSLAVTAEVRNTRLLVHLILNAYSEPLDFELPSSGAEARGPWRRWIDTSLDSPNDIVPWPATPPVRSSTYRAHARSVVVLYANAGDGPSLQAR
jgi:glycogen operon protein